MKGKCVMERLKNRACGREVEARVKLDIWPSLISNHYYQSIDLGREAQQLKAIPGAHFWLAVFPPSPSIEIPVLGLPHQPTRLSYLESSKLARETELKNERKRN